MAQDGDTITYTHDDDTDSDGRLIPEQEDISSIGEITVEYADGAGTNDGGTSDDRGSGGRVKNVDIDVSSEDNLYIWVAGTVLGRYEGKGPAGRAGGGSTEVSFNSKDAGDTGDATFLIGAGGGGNAGNPVASSGGGGRDGDADISAEGVAPPKGGNGQVDDVDGDAAVDDQNRGYILDGGTTTKGGGSAPGNNGEVKLSFQSGLEPPDPPSNLTAEVQ